MVKRNSYSDYDDLLLKCQNDGKYRVFTFDVVNSKKMDISLNYVSHYDLCFIIERVYQDLLMLQKELNNQILINDEGYQRFFDKCLINNCGQMPYDWFMLGDMVGITIHNKSIPKEVVYKIFSLNEKEMNLHYGFHKADLVYETDDYGMGNKKYFRGYAIIRCSNLHKMNEKFIKELDKVKTNMPITSEEVEYYMNFVYKNHHNSVMEAIKVLSSVRNGANELFMDENGKYNYKFYGNESYGKIYDYKKIKKMYKKY